MPTELGRESTDTVNLDTLVNELLRHYSELPMVLVPADAMDEIFPTSQVSSTGTPNQALGSGRIHLYAD